MPFSIPANKKYLHKSETHFIPSIATLQAINDKYFSKALKMSYFHGPRIGIHSLISSLAGTEIERSNQALEYVKSLLKTLESENFLLQPWSY